MRTVDGLGFSIAYPREGQGDFDISILATDIQYSNPAFSMPKGFCFDITPGVTAKFQFSNDLSTLTVSGFVWTEIEEVYNIKFLSPLQLQSTILSILQNAARFRNSISF